MSSDSQRINEIVSRFLKRIEAGEKLVVEDLIREHPDLASALRLYIENATRLGRTPLGDTRLTASDSSNFTGIAFQTLYSQGFEVRDELGRGGMGIVYRATELKTGQDVAVKVLPPVMASNPIRMARFQQEAKAASQLADSHIVPILNVIDDPVPMIVMPLIEGGTLRTLLRRREAPAEGNRWSALSDENYFEKIFRVGDRILEAMVAMHRRQILHRDIKPANILIDDQDEAWLSDFGLARLADQEESLTSTGDQLGTRGYMSPEQIEAKVEVDQRADLFGLGVTLYEALTGVLPYGRMVFDSNSPLPPAPSKIEPRLPPNFDNVILKAIEPDRRRRYGSAEEFQRDWNLARQGMRPKAHAPRRWVRRLGSTRVRGTVAIAAITAVMILSLGVGYSLFRPAVIAKPGEEIINIITRPPGAKLAIYPLDPVTGEPMTLLGIHPAGTTPLKCGLRPGDYHVTAYLDNDRETFHEVVRCVPEKANRLSPSTVLRHRYWKVLPDDSLEWMAITLWSNAAVDSMIPIQPGMVTMQGLPEGDPRSGRAFIHGFAIDATEMTVEQLAQNGGNVSPVGKQSTSTEHAIVLNRFNAISIAESLGKRLPSLAEYQFVATNCGRNRFPWGDTFPATNVPVSDSFGPVRDCEFDFMESYPGVRGLCSNVAEHLSSRIAVSDAEVRMNGAKPSDLWLIAGGDFETAQGNPAVTEGARSPHQMASLSALIRYPGVGYRGVRSLRPRIRATDFTQYGMQPQGDPTR